MLYRVINGRLRVRNTVYQQGETVEMNDDESAVAVSVGVVEAVAEAKEEVKSEAAPVNNAHVESENVAQAEEKSEVEVAVEAPKKRRGRRPKKAK